MRNLIVGAALALSLVVAGCASGGGLGQAQELDRLVGKGDKKVVVDKFGLPDKQAALDAGADMWEYRLNEQKYTSSTGYRFATYDLLRLSFKDGKLSGWTRTSEVK